MLQPLHHRFSVCENLRKIQFRGTESADAIINLRAKNLREISGDCCRKMTDITLCIREVDANAINALGKYCQNLTDIGFINCQRVDETALGNVVSVRFLSMAGTTYIQWDLVVQHWSKVLLAVFTDILTGVAKLCVGTPKNDRNIFLHWRNSKKDKKLGEILNWLEWIISDSLLRVSKRSLPNLDNFWLDQGTTLLLSLTQSAQEKVQERAATALATFVKKNYIIDTGRAEAVMRDDGIRILLNLAQSRREGLQSEAVKARFLEASAFLQILPGLLIDWSHGEAALGLWNLSAGEDLEVGALANLTADEKYSIEFASVGGVHALVTLARSCKAKGVQEQAARALTNFTSHGDTNHNAAAVGQETGALDALVQLIRSRHDGVRQEAAGALWNLSSDDRNQEAVAAAGGVEALLILFVESRSIYVNACTWMCLSMKLFMISSFQNGNSCISTFMFKRAYVPSSIHGIQETAAGALWGLSGSESNSIAIGRGGVVPLIALARSSSWSLGLNPGNALRIVEEGGVPALVHLCSSSLYQNGAASCLHWHWPICLMEGI
ncbi:hypothetical protein DH2020_023394 [Rehmannia glutinosa]|uniref:Uncharacterized protein n=1 Tax=Rehmannia glutinosa TaxID=99300 RepID=A0ABR0W5X5_REHGL